MSAPVALKIENLHVSVGETPILKGVNLTMRQGETHALMGPNGSGKSTLAYTLIGHPKYEITEGIISIDGTDINELDPCERARLGMFLAFQYPVTIPGVKVADFLRHAMTNIRNPDRKEGEELMSMRDFRKELRDTMNELNIDAEFARRYLNDGFSGGEKKRMEILQMTLLGPKFGILDETDSGLDIDALRVVSEGVNALRADKRSFLVITHYQRLLEYIKPDVIHVLANGRVVRSGGPELALELEKTGYKDFIAAAA
ncbi:MAG: Fe-S cluster assembly ATPase SufC [Planctomycetaceae bacterium]|nr:Fe-S cluster assembly ATPase SufC [Planctomycetaceae bacterium]